MSDEKKFEQMMGKHVDTTNRSRELTPEQMRHFNRAAITCELCGNPLPIDPQTNDVHQPTDWERKWSVHSVCAHKMYKQIDYKYGR